MIGDRHSQVEVFGDTAASLVSDFVAGRNCCVLAYGETKSGKSHTILGAPGGGDRIAELGAGRYDDNPNEEDDDDDDDNKSGVSSLGSAGVSRHPELRNSQVFSVGEGAPPSQVIAESRNNSPMGMLGRHLKRKGIQADGPLFDEEESGLAPRVVREVFEMFRKRRSRLANEGDQPKLGFSFVQIYLERIYDLLNAETVEQKDDDRPTLSIRSSREKGVHVENAVELQCSSEEEVWEGIQQGLNVRDELASQMKTGTSRSEKRWNHFHWLYAGFCFPLSLPSSLSRSNVCCWTKAILMPCTVGNTHACRYLSPNEIQLYTTQLNAIPHTDVGIDR